MLCPEVWNFPPPKTVCSHKKYESLESTTKIIGLNNFYHSVIITCPDEIQTPVAIKEALEDSDYYKVIDFPLAEFLEPIFIKSFIKCGRLFCLSAGRNCIVQNCACITSDGVLTLHILEFIYQTLGLEGTKLPHNFYQIKIDLHNLKNVSRIKTALEKLEKMDFYVSWEPETDNICPSSIAKYLSDRKLNVECVSLSTKQVTPDIDKIPTLDGAEIDEVVEWIGMLAHNAVLQPNEDYISTYTEPDCDSSIETNRISLLIVKGFLTPTIVTNLASATSNYVKTRDLSSYWACLSVQSNEDSLWRWGPSSPSMFQPHNNSCNIFFTNEEQIVYSKGQLKFS